MGKLGLLLVAIMASGCATLHTPPNVDPENYLPITQEKSNYYSDPPTRGKVYAAVYSYADLTGQRAQGTQTLSTAVTQGGANYLISALSDYSDRSWFRVVERTSVDNILRERQIVRSTRQAATGDTKLPAMLYAGVIFDGGIIGYDANVQTGGQGARIFGLGMAEKYSHHLVTVSLRVISVTTSEVLLTVITEKNIVSYGDNITGMRFFDLDREVLEIENGMNVNEASSYAVRKAIEKSVHDIVRQGIKRNVW